MIGRMGNENVVQISRVLARRRSAERRAGEDTLHSNSLEAAPRTSTSNNSATSLKALTLLDIPPRVHPHLTPLLLPENIPTSQFLPMMFPLGTLLTPR